MKKFLGILLMTSLLPLLPLKSDWNETLSDTDVKIVAAQERGPFTFSIEGDAYGKANFDKHCIRHQKISYYYIDAEAAMVFYYDKCREEGAVISLGFINDMIKWKQNPFFHQQYFNSASIALSGFTKRAEDWTWKSQIRLNLETNHLILRDQLTLDLILWGRYAATCNLGIDFGFLAYTGMKIDRILPIIGLDWKVNEKWQLNAVFPVDISATYKFNDNWTVAVNTRFIETRHRVGPDERLSRGLVEYRNAGIEFALNYIRGQNFNVNAHIGYMAGGVLKIATRHYHHKRHFDFDSAPYAGGEMAYNF